MACLSPSTLLFCAAATSASVLPALSWSQSALVSRPRYVAAALTNGGPGGRRPCGPGEPDCWPLVPWLAWRGWDFAAAIDREAPTARLVARMTAQVLDAVVRIRALQYVR